MEQVLWLSRAGLVRELELGVRVLHSDDERVVMFPFASVLGLPTNSPCYVATISESLSAGHQHKRGALSEE